jgi:hypothetical protein
MLKVNVVVPFHKNVCSQCHTIPKSKEWATAPDTGKFYSLFVFLSFRLSLFLYFWDERQRGYAFNKKDLIPLLNASVVIPFHKNVCLLSRSQSNYPAPICFSNLT